MGRELHIPKIASIIWGMAKQTVWQEIGNRIHDECIESGKTMADICRECGITEQTLRNWRAGDNLPDRENWERLAKILGTSVRAMLTEKPKARMRA